ncbi:MAG: PPC domain-containing protein, partial [Myxococcota bacterium]
MRAASLLMISLLSLWTPAGRAGMLESVVNQKGKLERTDQTLQDGSWADVYPVDLEVGDRLLVEMQSNRLDTYVAVRSPSNQTFENDDSGAPNQSMVDLFAEEAGTWLVYATSSQPETRGRYHIRVAVDSSNRGQSPVSNTPNNNSGDEGVTAISPGQTVQGRLQAGDRTLANGEWTDLYSVDVQAGQRLVVDMSSTDFDTYIGVRSPSGSVDGNDDHDGDRNRSRFEGVVEESGQWTIFATSYSAEERGDYALTVDVGENTTPIASGDGLERWSGILADGDDQLSSGEYVDKYRI